MRCGRRVGTYFVEQDGDNYVVVTDTRPPIVAVGKTLQEAEQKLADKTGAFVYNPDRDRG